MAAAASAPMVAASTPQRYRATASAVGDSAGSVQFVLPPDATDIEFRVVGAGGAGASGVGSGNELGHLYPGGSGAAIVGQLSSSLAGRAITLTAGAGGRTASAGAAGGAGYGNGGGTATPNTEGDRRYVARGGGGGGGSAILADAVPQVIAGGGGGAGGNALAVSGGLDAAMLAASAGGNAGEDGGHPALQVTRAGAKINGIQLLSTHAAEPGLPASNMIDGNFADGSHFHSPWGGTVTLPYNIDLSLGSAPVALSTLAMTPREGTGGNSNGRPADYRIFVGATMAELEASQPVAEGVWENTGTQKVASLAGHQAQFLRLQIIHTHGQQAYPDDRFVAIRELEVFAAEGQVDILRVNLSPGTVTPVAGGGGLGAEGSTPGAGSASIAYSALPGPTVSSLPAWDKRGAAGTAQRAGGAGVGDAYKSSLGRGPDAVAEVRVSASSGGGGGGYAGGGAGGLRVIKEGAHPGDFLWFAMVGGGGGGGSSYTAPEVISQTMATADNGGAIQANGGAGTVEVTFTSAEFTPGSGVVAI